MVDDALEFVRVAVEPVHHVATVARARGGHARRVDVGLLFEVREAGHQVLVGLAAPVARDLVGEFLAEAGRTAGIGHRDHIAAGGPHLRVPAGGPRIQERALRSAVHPEDERILFRCVEPRRLQDPQLYRRATRATDRDRFGWRERELREERGVGVRDGLGRAVAEADSGDLRRLGEALPGERDPLPVGRDGDVAVDAARYDPLHLAARYGHAPHGLRALILRLKEERLAVGRPSETADRAVPVTRHTVALAGRPVEHPERPLVGFEAGARLGAVGEEFTVG